VQVCLTAAADVDDNVAAFALADCLITAPLLQLPDLRVDHGQVPVVDHLMALGLVFAETTLQASVVVQRIPGSEALFAVLTHVASVLL
jgi:hypothetical protein